MADYAPEEYTRHYIVQALFKLMQEYSYEKINVTDIVQKAGVGRATFYRYFKSKEDVITYYFEHHTREFVFGQGGCASCVSAQARDLALDGAQVRHRRFARLRLASVAPARAGLYPR